MPFTWPWALLALLVLPALAGVWWWARRRRRRAAVRVTSIALVAGALRGRSRWHRRIPAALLALGLGVLAVGVARPQATVPVASSSATIMVALDVSGSMCSTDVRPNRITAAEEAATTFIKAESGGPRIGLVAFNGTAGVLVPPTYDTSKLLSALRSLTTGPGTAIGEAILTSLDAISEVDPSVAPTGARTVKAAAGAGYASDVIVLLTDGSNNQGVAPQTAAKQAALRRVRVFTIGFGTTTPTAMVCGGTELGGGFGGFGSLSGFDGAGNPLAIDVNALKEIAATTGGRFYRAQNASELHDALSNLRGRFTIVRKHVDLASWFAGIGGLLIAAAVGLSLWWSRIRRGADPGGRPPGAPRVQQT